MDLSKILNPQNPSYFPPDTQFSDGPSVRLSGLEPGKLQCSFIHSRFETSNYPLSSFQPRNAATLPSPVTPEGLSALKIAKHEGRLLPSPSQSPLSLSTETYQVPATSFEPIPTHANMPNPAPKCEFSDGPCVTGGENLRKVISHIFGRNKNCTKLFPQHVWIHYCRKHYQRARYRASVWPFTQCDLLMDSLDRMEAWGGVDSFELVLRRRETRRTTVDNDGETNEQNLSTSGFPSPEASSPNSVVSFSQTNATQTQDSSSTMNENLSKKPPYIPPSPVPDWLREEVGPNKSFNDIRDIVTRLKEYMAMLQAMDEKVMFPDIEILPRFRPGLIIAENDRVIIPRTRTSPPTVFQDPVMVSRVSKKGGIQKYTTQ